MMNGAAYFLGVDVSIYCDVYETQYCYEYIPMAGFQIIPSLDLGFR